jgi:mannose-6-phosphate isomerase-like protein (cupin superfamily)
MKSVGGGREMDGFIDNIEEATEDNSKFSHVLYTGKHFQLVVMSIPTGEEAGEEVHEDREITDGEGVVVPAGARHNIKSVGKNQLRPYTAGQITRPGNSPTLAFSAKEHMAKRNW